MNDNAGVWIAGLAFAVSVAALFARFVHRLSKIESRVEALEKDGREIDARIAQLHGMATVMGDLVNNMRVHAAESFVSLEHMSKVETKMDTVADRAGKIETTQAEHGATLKAIQESLGDLKRSVGGRRGD